MPLTIISRKTVANFRRWRKNAVIHPRVVGSIFILLHLDWINRVICTYVTRYWQELLDRDFFFFRCSDWSWRAGNATFESGILRVAGSEFQYQYTQRKSDTSNLLRIGCRLTVKHGDVATNSFDRIAILIYRPVALSAITPCLRQHSLPLHLPSSMKGTRRRHWHSTPSF